MNIWVDANGWPFPPLILLGCLVAEALYFRGWIVLVKEEQAKSPSRTGSSPVFFGFNFNAGEFQGNSWLWRGVLFLSALFALLLASSAPVDNLSGRFFWIHMVQHLLLLVVMAPLLVAGAPLLAWWLGLPVWARRFLQAFAKLRAGRILYRLGYWMRQPAISCALLIIGILL